MHSVELQIQADSVWANRCMKRLGNTILRFHLIAYYVSGNEFFTGNYIL